MKFWRDVGEAMMDGLRDQRKRDLFRFDFDPVGYFLDRVFCCG